MNSITKALSKKRGIKDSVYTFKSPFSGKDINGPIFAGAGTASRIGGGARALAKSEAIQGMEKRILNTVKPSVRGSLIKARNALRNI